MTPDIIICGLGTNDFFYGNASFYQSNMTEMLSTMRTSYPNVPIVLVKIPVTTGTGANNITKASAQWAVIDTLAATDNKIIVWDWYKLLAQSTGSYMSSDKLHPSAMGANALANDILTWLLPANTSNTVQVGIGGQPDWTAGTKSVFSDLVVAPGAFGGTNFTRLTTGAIGTVMTSTNVAGFATPGYSTLGARNITVWSGLDVAWDSQPTAVTELFGGTKHRFYSDTSMASQVRVTAHVVDAGGTGAALAVQYSADGSTWAYPGASSTPSVAITTANSDVASSWADLVVAAKADLRWRIVGSCTVSGSPSFSSINVEFR